MLLHVIFFLLSWVWGNKKKTWRFIFNEISFSLFTIYKLESCFSQHSFNVSVLCVCVCLCVHNCRLSSTGGVRLSWRQEYVNKEINLKIKIVLCCFCAIDFFLYSSIQKAYFFCCCWKIFCFFVLFSCAFCGRKTKKKKSLSLSHQQKFFFFFFKPFFFFFFFGGGGGTERTCPSSWRRQPRSGRIKRRAWPRCLAEKVFGQISERVLGELNTFLPTRIKRSVCVCMCLVGRLEPENKKKSQSNFLYFFSFSSLSVLSLSLSLLVH